MQLFAEPLFQMFADRALAMLGVGAEYGECAATAARINDSNSSRVGGGDDGAATVWHREWTATAATVRGWAEDSETRGHRTSAREAYLRATTYARISYTPLFGAPVDPRLAETARFEHECFTRFAALADVPLRAVEVPYGSTTLPGWLCLADDSGRPRRTLVAVDGYDANVHEMWWSHALPALRRGYHCLLVDGPGQGRPLVEQGLRMRPDWEHVLRPVLDLAVTLPEVDPARIAVMGWSFGGYLAPRGAAGDDRVAALVADPGQWDQMAGFRSRLPIPPELRDRLPDVAPAELEPYLAALVADPIGRWRFAQRGLWVHGLDTLGEYVVELGRYTLSDVVEGIRCPTLVVQAADDPLAAMAGVLFDALPGPKTLAVFGPDDMAPGHCESWNRARFAQRAFDWLDEALPR